MPVDDPTGSPFPTPNPPQPCEPEPKKPADPKDDDLDEKVDDFKRKRGTL